MIWRVWSFLAGVPIGGLAVLAVRPDPALSELIWGGLGAGILLLALPSALARARADAPDRGRHLAAAVSVGWLALPALGVTWLELAPGARGLLPAVLVVVAIALARGARRGGTAGGPVRWLGRATLAVGLGAATMIGLAGMLAAIGARVPPVSARRQALIFDLDAQVATRPLPRCTAQPRYIRVLLERGAHPRLGPDGAALWFDATAPDGSRQVHRLERATRRVECWTCDEPGNNFRPAPAESGKAVVFVTDRYASWRHPVNSEIQLAFVGSGNGKRASRRLTHRPGADDHPLLGPGSRFLVWSRARGGRYDVVAATLHRGHGGVTLGSAGVLASGGAAWVAPLAWSPDARSLIVVRGNPFAPLVAYAIDPASGERMALGEDVGGSASFSADGGWFAVTTAGRSGFAARLPQELGFLLGPWAARHGLGEPLLAGSGVRTGRARAGPGQPVQLPALAGWGEPTGVALEPDGAGFVLGQRRRRAGAKVEERLVQVVLDCEPAAAAQTAVRLATRQSAGGEL